MKRLLFPTLFVFAAGTAAQADLSVTLGGGWDGKKVPPGQQCTLYGGKGATPPMKVTGLPDGTARVIVEYNDRDYRPLARRGGHGVISYPVQGASADLYSVPGLKRKLPGGAVVVSKARSEGDFASDGYLPPCSGGRGHRYFADLKAVDKGGRVLDKTRVEIGRY